MAPIWPTLRIHSNAYGSDLHVPIHSNAGTSDCTSPFNSANGGTWLIYADLADQAAGNYILSAMQSYSPGTNDLICLDTQCTAVGQLHELRATNMPAAYVEAAFHTYGPDEDWLRLTSTVGNRLAVGIDNYFGNPRCPPYCPNGIAPKDPLLTPQAPTVHYVVPTGGKDFPALSEALSSLLEGPAHGAQSVFSKQTSGMVKGVTIIDGLAIVDFANFKDRIPNASTSFVRAQLLAELNSVVFGFKNVDAVLYRFDGNHESFASWLELVPVPFMRSDWTGVNNLAQPVDGN